MSPGGSPLEAPRHTTPDVLRTRQSVAFGSFVGRLALPFGCPSDMDAALHTEWQRLAAEEILLAKLCGLAVHSTWIEALKETTPLADPRFKAIGVNPRIAASAVIMIGRSLSTPA